MLAATPGGLAFSQSSVTLIHGMSRPIGALFHVPHGLGNAMLLPAVTAWSISGAPTRYADCARAMGMAAASDSDAAANQLACRCLWALLTTTPAFRPEAAAVRRAGRRLAVPNPRDRKRRVRRTLTARQRLEEAERAVWSGGAS